MAKHNIHLSPHSICGSEGQVQLIYILCSGSPRLKSKCCPGLWSHLSLESLFKVHVVVGKIHFLVAIEIMATCFFKAMRRASLLLPSLTSEPFFKWLDCLGQAQYNLPFNYCKVRRLETSIAFAKSLQLCHLGKHNGNNIPSPLPYSVG